MVCVFARKTSEPLTSLVKQIDEKIGENGKLKSFVVVLTQKGDQTAEELKKYIVNPKSVKADSKMKAYSSLPAEDMDALVAYLGTLIKKGS